MLCCSVVVLCYDRCVVSHRFDVALPFCCKHGLCYVLVINVMCRVVPHVFFSVVGLCCFQFGEFFF